MNEDLWKILTSINEWVRFLEGKAIALLTAQGVLIAILSQTLLAEKKTFETMEILLSGVAIILNTASMIFSFMCLNPRLKLKGGTSPLFFGSIASSFKNSNEYFEFYKGKMNTDESISKELCGQIFVNSQIAERKCRNVTFSIRLFFGSALAWILFIVTRTVC